MIRSFRCHRFGLHLVQPRTTIKLDNMSQSLRPYVQDQTSVTRNSTAIGQASAQPVTRDSGLGSTAVATEEYSGSTMSNAVPLVSPQNSIAFDIVYPTVTERPLGVVHSQEGGPQSWTEHLAENHLQMESGSLAGIQSLPVQKAAAGELFTMTQHPSLTKQLSVKHEVESSEKACLGNVHNSGSTSSSLSSLKFPTQVASESNSCGSIPAGYRDNCSSSLTTNLFNGRSAIGTLPTEDDLNEIVINSYEFREDFKEKQYDIVLIYSESDRDLALAFRTILIKFIVLEDGRHPSICVLDQNAHLTYITSRFTHMEEALKRSTYMFLFLTKDFCGDGWAQLQRDECLMESIHNPEKKWCVVPILTKPRKEADYQLPFGLRALKGVEISHMLRGKTLDSVDVDTLLEKDIDIYFLKNMKKMLSDRIYLKMEREKKQLTAFQEWLKIEKHRRWKIMKIEEHEKNIAEELRIKERQYLQKQLEARKNSDLKAAEAAARRTAEEEDAEHFSQNKMTEDVRSERLKVHVPSIGDPKPEKGPLGKEEGMTVHNHYYAPVSKAPVTKTVYKIYGQVSESQIGSNNMLVKNKETSDHVVLEATNLETDTPDAVEYVVEVEGTSSHLEDDAVINTVFNSSSASGAVTAMDWNAKKKKVPTATLR